MKRLILVCLLSLAACVDYRAIGLNIHPRPPAVVVQPPVIVEPPAPPVRATGAQLLDYKGCLGTLRDSANRVVWTPALPGAPVDVRAEWYQLLREAGCTHVPIGPFGPGPSYPGIVAWNNPDWLNDPAAIRGLVEELLNTPSADGLGFRPVIFTDGGPRNPKPRLQAFFPVLSQALEGLDDYVIVVPAGWEPVVGDFTSAEVSWALETWHAYRPRSLIGYHGSPGRLVGSSNCTPDTPGCAHGYEDDDPWKGGEAEFYRSHGGEFISIALYQFPHGDSTYRDCDEDDESGACPLNRWQDYVSRIGTGFHGWRVLKIAAFEITAYEVTRGLRSFDEARQATDRALRVCRKWGVSCGWGDGPPSQVGLSVGDALALPALSMDSSRRDGSQARVLGSERVPLRTMRARRVTVSALADHVSDVVPLSSKEQVARPNAGRNVASVADLLSFRNWAVLHFPREPVSVDNQASSNTEFAVTKDVLGTGPNPTPFGLIHVARKPDLGWNLGSGSEEALLGAVVTSPLQGELVRRQTGYRPTNPTRNLHARGWPWHIPILPT